MSSHEEWLEEVISQINNHKTKFSESEIRKYKLDFLLDLSRQVSEHSENCVDCIGFQEEILGIIDDVGYFGKRMNEAKVPGEVKRNYFKVIAKISLHLEKEHNRTKSGSSPKKKNQYIGAGIAVGIGLGIIIDNIGLGIAIGIAIAAIAKKYKIGKDD